METIYNTYIPNEITSEYISCLIDRVYSLLPKYEESRNDNEKNITFEVYQISLIQTINGNIKLIQYNNKIVLDILSHLECLKDIDSHAEYKRHILKICNLLNKLKKEVEKDGL
jgi:hypothetical protein